MQQQKKFLRFGLVDSRIALLGVLLFLGFVLLFLRLPGSIAAMEKQRKYDSEFYAFSNLFTEVYQDIRERYVEDVDSKTLFEGAIRGLFASLNDPHSSWLSPDSLQQLEKETEGEFSGVGLHITLDQNVLTVIAPIPGSPAARAGVAPWDRVVEIDGKTTENMTLLEAVKKLTGPPGSSVKIKVFREGETDMLEFTLVRDTIHVDSVFSTRLGANEEIGYIRLVRFADDTADATRKALDEFHASPNPPKGYIVDVRYNSGGLLDKVIEMCGFFLPKDQLVVSTKGRKAENNRTFNVQTDPICDEPIVILVNRGSASASEILAGALQDTKRAVVMGPKGEKTFGKGSVQTITYLKNSLERDDNGEPLPSGIRLTTAKYYTPSGRTIHEIGITPDVEIEVSRESQRELLRRGLLGDPDTSRLDRTAPAAPEGKSPDAKPEEGAAEEAEPAEPEAPEASDAEPAEFHDVLLDAAIKHMTENMLGAGKIAGKS